RAVGPEHSVVGQRDALWVDLANLTAGSKYAGTSFILPGHGELAAEMSDNFFAQTPILKDDGFTISEVTLKGIKLLENVEPEAMLTIETDGAPFNALGRWIKPLDGDDEHRELTFQFDSPAMLGLIREDGTVGPISLILTLKEGETYPFSDLLYMATGGIPN
ncbi:MAG: hypothetical protein IIC26_08685, partial [Chloroflexi bacterium]|nr:hypothetical protein [Chloroflexota bacterium]